MDASTSNSHQPQRPIPMIQLYPDSSCRNHAVMVDHVKLDQNVTKQANEVLVQSVTSSDVVGRAQRLLTMRNICLRGVHVWSESVSLLKQLDMVVSDHD